jgi:hypothetical protein
MRRSTLNRPGRELVRGAGLEPARYFYHEPLKLACLPVPPPSHEGSLSYLWLLWEVLAGAVTGADDPVKTLEESRRVELYAR